VRLLKLCQGVANGTKSKFLYLVPRSMESNAALRREMTIANPEPRGLLAGSAVAHSVFYWALGLRFFILVFALEAGSHLRSHALS
jgi:hypothetical protein